MVDSWLCSDTHFGHANIIKFTCHNDPSKPIRPGWVDSKGDLQPFTDIQYHDEMYIARHNARVGPNHKVYFLGDFGKPLSMLDRLNGKFNFILGNHDEMHDVRKLAAHPKVKWVRSERCLMEEFAWPVRLIHYPTHPMMDFPSIRRICVHGHIHEKVVRRLKEKTTLRWGEEDPWYVNVCVEHTNHAPMHWDELSDIIRKRKVTLEKAGELNEYTRKV